MNTSAEDLQSKITRALLAFSALWSVAVGIWTAVTPLYVEEIVAVNGTNIGTEPILNRNPVSFYSMQGAWGIFILVVFALLFSSGAILFRRGLPGLTAMTGLLAISLTYLAGFSIGPGYLPAAVTTFATITLITIRRIRRAPVK